MKKLSIIVFGMLFIYHLGFSQSDAHYWGEISVFNYYTGEKTDGLSIGVSLNYSLGNHLFRIKGESHEEFLPLGTNFPEKFKMLGALYGRAYAFNNFRLNLSAGLGLFWGVKRGELDHTDPNGGFFPINYYQKDEFSVASIPLEIDLQFLPIKYAGLGVFAFANLNKKQSLYGMGAKISLGYIRE